MANQATAGRQMGGFRPDIQGLRAVAVLLVLAFHSRLPIPGGFVGVDVFFVISGYVITNMLLKEWNENGSLKLARFWRRRFFRLTPALALVVGVTFVLAGLLLLPLEQQVTYQTGVGSLLFIANIVIARTTGGYFDAPAEQNPLLNTWSLSVEEQFYLIFPLILATALVLARRSKRSTLLPTIAIGGIGLVSVTIMFWSVTPSADGVTWLNFYSPITRSWEFAAGSLLASLTWGKALLRPGLGSVLRVAGGLALTMSVFVISKETPFPGPWTLLPVGATVLLLLGGSARASRMGFLTRSIPMRIGDWSYSIYLWHWPLIVFAVALGLESPAWLLGVALISFIPAALSYRYVETPLRNWTPNNSRLRVPVGLSILAAPLALVPVLIATATPSPRFEGTVGTEYLETIWATSYPCELEQIDGAGSRCFQSKEGTPLDIVIVGDSHAEDLYLGLKDNAPSENVGYVYLPDWPYRSDENARLTFKQLAQSPNLRAVVINSKWDPDGVTSDGVKSALRALESSDARIFIADDRPTFPFHAERCQYEPLIGSRATCDMGASEFESRYEDYRRELETLVRNQPGAALLETSAEFCTDQSCSMTSGETLLYADNGHLNELGSQMVLKRVLLGNPDFRRTLLASDGTLLTPSS